MDELSERLVFAQQGKKIHGGFFFHGLHERVGAPGVVDGVHADPRTQRIETQPLSGKKTAKRFSFGVPKHASELLLDHFR